MKIEVPKHKAVLIYGEDGLSTSLSIYKKPNLLLRAFLYLLGIKVELNEEEK